jgi:hypothetical protein
VKCGKELKAPLGTLFSLLCTRLMSSSIAFGITFSKASNALRYYSAVFRIAQSV